MEGPRRILFAIQAAEAASKSMVTEGVGGERICLLYLIDGVGAFRFVMWVESSYVLIVLDLVFGGVVFNFYIWVY